MNDSQNSLLPDMDIKVDDHAKKELIDAAKWSKIISIIMFVFAGIVLLMGVVGSSQLSSGVFRSLGRGYGDIFRYGGAWLIIVVLVVVVVIGVLYYFLFSFSTKMKTAVLAEDTPQFNASLKMLKVFLIATTVLAILSLLMNIMNLFK